eukprot:jgi/Chrzof1/12735/Cz07g05200.t1
MVWTVRDPPGVCILLANSKCGAVTVSSLTVSYVCLSASPRHAYLLASAHDWYGCYAPIHFPNSKEPARQQQAYNEDGPYAPQGTTNINTYADSR